MSLDVESGTCHAGCVTTHREPWPSAADPLGEALHFLELRGAFYCRAEFTAPFGLELPPLEGYLWFHVITGGSCWLEAVSYRDLTLPTMWRV
jgi:hypothetical protein